MSRLDEAPDEAAHRLPRDTTPTWEVELLISGVAVFAMLQLPGWLDDLIFAWRPRFEPQAGELLGLLYIYAKGAALILATTFVLHLLLRAHWIALVGLHSIHPRGVDWDRLELGPRAREIAAARFGRMEDRIEHADNRASTVFALGVILASFLIGVAATVTLAMGVLTLVDARLGVRIPPSDIALAFAVLMIGYALVLAADRRLGARLPTGSTGDRLLRALLRTYAAVGLGAARSPGLALLSSMHGRRRVVLLIVGVMMAAMLTVTASYSLMRDPDAFGSYAGFPEASTVAGRTIDSAHYDDRRNPARDPLVPYIQSAVVTGPYLQLVVPYDPRNDEAARRQACPAAAGMAALACLQRLRPVTIDGRSLAVTYDIGRDARTDRPALVAMVDVRGLVRGRHELRVARASTPSGAKGNDSIAFWR